VLPFAVFLLPELPAMLSLPTIDWLAPKYLDWMLWGVLETLFLSLLVALVATAFGLLLAAMRDSRRRVLNLAALAYQTVFRNTPLLVQLLFWYFGASSLLPAPAIEWLNTPRALTIAAGWTLPCPSFEFIACLFGLSLYSASFIAEEIRAGIRGVPFGQRQAAAALGLTGWQTMRWVVLPQALRIALPPLFGQYMNVVKNTSLTMAIGVVELSYTSRQIETETLKTFQAFGVATLFYIAIIVAIELALQQLRQGRWAPVGEGRR